MDEGRKWRGDRIGLSFRFGGELFELREMLENGSRSGRRAGCVRPPLISKLLLAKGTA